MSIGRIDRRNNMSTWNTVKNALSIKGQQNAFARAREASSGYAINSPSTLWNATKNYFTPQSAYAAETSTPNGGTTGYSKKPDGGYDYMISGQPASLQDYANTFGIENVPQDEPALSQLNQPSGQNTLDNAINTSDQTNPQGTTNGMANDYQTLFGTNGEVIGNYNLANSADRQRYFNDKSGYLTTIRDKYISDLQTNTTKGLGEAKLSSDKTLAAIDQDLADLQTEAKNYVQGYYKRVNEFGDQKNMGDINRQQFFTKLSPNAFQSSQGTSQEYANKKYTEGLGDFANEANTNVGNAFLANPNDMNTLDAGSTFGRNRTSLVGQQNDTKKQYNDYVTTANENLTAGVQGANDNFNTQVGQVANAFSIPNKVQGLDPFQYTRSSIPQAKASTADMSSYQPFTNFANPGQTFTPSGVTIARTPNAFNDQTPLDNFLGKNVVQDDQKDYLRKYLLGKS